MASARVDGQDALKLASARVGCILAQTGKKEIRLSVLVVPLVFPHLTHNLD